MDYYLLHNAPGQVNGLLVEEFDVAADHSTVGLNCAGWTPADANWWSSAEFSRNLRSDAALRARLLPANRAEAVVAYGRLGGGDLPAEAALRTYFTDYAPLAGGTPLVLNPPPVPAGFTAARIYRILCAGELTDDRLADLQVSLRLSDGTDRIAGSGRQAVAGDAFTWELRRIGLGVAWCLDLTAHLRTGAADRIGPMLRDLTATVRRHGLIPVTTERFA